jgi:hypothetical protein
MANPIIKIVNLETNEEIEREMTADEFKTHQAELAAYTAKKDEAIKKAEAKAAIAERLGLSADELATLLA